MPNLDKTMDVLAIIAGVILLALMVAFGFIELSLQAIFGYLAIAVVAAYLGVMLGRRSKQANKYADLIDAQIREADARTRAMLKSNGIVD